MGWNRQSVMVMELKRENGRITFTDSPVIAWIIGSVVITIPIIILLFSHDTEFPFVSILFCCFGAYLLSFPTRTVALDLTRRQMRVAEKRLVGGKECMIP